LRLLLPLSPQLPPPLVSPPHPPPLPALQRVTPLWHPLRPPEQPLCPRLGGGESTPSGVRLRPPEPRPEPPRPWAGQAVLSVMLPVPLQWWKKPAGGQTSRLRSRRRERKLWQGEQSWRP
jgi:hypothetical protein